MERFLVKKEKKSENFVFSTRGGAGTFYMGAGRGTKDFGGEMSGRQLQMKVSN